MRTQSTPLEREGRIAEIACAQWGVITLTQLTQVGLSPSAVRNRVAVGRLHRRHRGVYLVGHESVSWQGLLLGAVLACGATAVASHHAAARLTGLIERALRFHVTVLGRRVRVPGIDVHRTGRLEAADVTVAQRVPCTSWARTVCDTAALTGDRRLTERMIGRAEQLRIFDLAELRRASRARAGARIVASVLGVEPAMTRNEMEECFLAICEAAGLPRPRVNEPLVLSDGTHVVPDFMWPELNLIVETDGWETHGTRQAFRSDRRRDRRLALEGWRVVRFTWHEIEHEPERVAAELGMLVPLAS
jgi:predicted transcriptional regulator of viral defense system